MQRPVFYIISGFVLAIILYIIFVLIGASICSTTNQSSCNKIANKLNPFSYSIKNMNNTDGKAGSWNTNQIKTTEDIFTFEIQEQCAKFVYVGCTDVNIKRTANCTAIALSKIFNFYDLVKVMSIEDSDTLPDEVTTILTQMSKLFLECLAKNNITVNTPT